MLMKKDYEVNEKGLPYYLLTIFENVKSCHCGYAREDIIKLYLLLLPH